MGLISRVSSRTYRDSMAQIYLAWHVKTDSLSNSRQNSSNPVYIQTIKRHDSHILSPISQEPLASIFFSSRRIYLAFIYSVKHSSSLSVHKEQCRPTRWYEVSDGDILNYNGYCCKLEVSTGGSSPTPKLKRKIDVSNYKAYRNGNFGEYHGIFRHPDKYLGG